MGRSHVYSKRQRENKTNNSPTVMQCVKEGFGLGLGVSVANAVVERTMDHFVSPRKIEVAERCKNEREELDKCYQQNRDCKDLLEKYNKCKSN